MSDSRSLEKFLQAPLDRWQGPPVYRRNVLTGLFMTDIPRWPKISLLDDPDEEERAKRQLNESRRRRGLEPLYPEAGFPDVPGIIDTLFGGGKPIPLGGYRDGSPEPERPDSDPLFLIDPKDVRTPDAAPNRAGGESQVAQADRPPAAPKEGGRSAETAPAPDKESAAPPKPGKPLTYEQVKELVRENNRSKLPDEMITAIIFKESSFIPDARNKSGASGLMQMQSDAWTDVHKKVLGQQNVPEFAQHVFDPAINVQRGSAYLQWWIDRSGGDVAKGLFGYGSRKPEYVPDVLAAADALKQNPDNPVAVLSRIYRRKYQ